jgi:hypothetical protein
VEVAVAQVDDGAEGREGVHVDVHGPRADGAAAGQRHDRLAAAREQWAQHEVGGAHLAHDVVVGARGGQRVGRERDDLAPSQSRDLAADDCRSVDMVRMSDRRGALVSVSGSSERSVAA